MLTDEIVVFSEKTMTAYGQRVLNVQTLRVTVKLSRIIRLRGGLVKNQLFAAVLTNEVAINVNSLNLQPKAMSKEFQAAYRKLHLACLECNNSLN